MHTHKRLAKKFVSLILAMLIFASVAVTGISYASAATDTKSIYFSSCGYWDKFFALYAWGDDYDSGKWYTLSAVSGEDDLYSADIATEYDNVIFCSRSKMAYNWDYVVNKTDALVIPDNCNHLTLAGVNTAVWSNYLENGKEILYFVPSQEWMNIQKISGHGFVVHAFSADDTDGVWVNMELTSGNYGAYPSTFSAEIDRDYDEVEFCRVEIIDSDGTFTIWEKSYSQTKPAGSNIFTQSTDGKNGTWSYTDYIEPDIPEETLPDTEPSEPEEIQPPAEDVKTKTIYFTSNETWKDTVASSIGRISAYAWNSETSEGTWYWLEESALSEAEYSVDINVAYDCILFGISYSDEPDGTWSETENLTIPDSSNHFTQDADDECIGIWSSIADVNANYYTVVFVNGDGAFISAQTVKEGSSATSPENPTREADAQYTYKFVGWDSDFSEVTEDITVKALYTKTVNKYTVVFKDYDGKVLSTQSIEYGSAAEAPESPTRTGYTFKGWDAQFDNIAGDLTVTATYSKNIDTVNTGKFSVEVSGGAGFTISVNGGAARPQGTSYYNTKMPINTSVTLVAKAAEGMEFLGWVNANMVVLSTEETYTFITTGNDFAKAVYRTDLDGASLVIFKNDKAAGGNGAILDLQYYVAGEEIVIPANPAQAGYDFAGWDMTSDQIAAKVAAGENVTVLATWTVAEVFVNVTVNGGTFVASKVNADGKIYANYAVTATANAAEEGKKFAYWADAETGEVLSYNAEYKFYPGKDTEITAIYVATDATVDYKVLVGMSADPNAETTKIRYYVTYYVPEVELGYEFVSAGVIIVDEANYKEDMFYHGSGLSGMTDTAPGSIQVATGNQPGAAVTKSNCFSGNTYYAKTWVIYKDAQGVEQIAYSDLLVVDKL